RDPNLGKVVLYQLSYSRTVICRGILLFNRFQSMTFYHFNDCLHKFTAKQLISGQFTLGAA
ncbi:hypothetical protein, partial [Idiomarina sp.]